MSFSKIVLSNKTWICWNKAFFMLWPLPALPSPSPVILPSHPGLLPYLLWTFAFPVPSLWMSTAPPAPKPTKGIFTQLLLPILPVSPQMSPPQKGLPKYLLPLLVTLYHTTLLTASILLITVCKYIFVIYVLPFFPPRIDALSGQSLCFLHQCIPRR